MSLFSCSPEWPREVSDSPSIVTSLGKVRIYAELHKVTLSEFSAFEMYRSIHDDRRWIWQSEEFIAELLMCRSTVPIPNEYVLDDCWSAIWRVQALRDIPSALFSCEWEGNHRWQDGYPENGENFLAFDWTDGHSSVSIGTEDSFALNARAQLGDWMTRRVVDLLMNEESVQMSHAGIQISLPGLLTDERIQIGFLVAWGATRDGTPPGWFAMDLQARQILATVGCR